FQSTVPATPSPYPFQTSGIGQDADLFDQSFSAPSLDNLCSVQKPMAGRTVLQVDQTTSAHQALFWYIRERSQNPNLDRGVRLRARRHHQKTPQPQRFAAHASTDSVRHPLRKTRSSRGSYIGIAGTKRHQLS